MSDKNISYKNVLLFLGGNVDGEAGIDAAIRLAVEWESHVIGLFVYRPPYFPLKEAVYVEVDLIAEYRNSMTRLAKTLRERFESAARANGVSFEWREEEGDLVDSFVSQAHYADLALLARPEGEAFEAPADYIAGEFVLSSGCPLLILPADGEPEVHGGRILIAWNDSAQTSRAVRDAMPLIKAAKDVLVVTVGKIDGQPEAAAELATSLARHQIRVTAVDIDQSEKAVQACIVDEAEKFGADLIIAGAWGHSRLREMIFGGVTKWLLRKAPFPVLLSH